MLHRTLMLAVLAPLISSTSTLGDAGWSIHVDVAGLRSDRGHVICFLYNSEVGFPMDHGLSIAKVKGVISGGQSSCDFPTVPAGIYAISAYHDENDNGLLDANFLGIPKDRGWSSDRSCHGHATSSVLLTLKRERIAWWADLLPPCANSFAI